jgi:hypothetical protein
MTKMKGKGLEKNEHPVLALHEYVRRIANKTVSFRIHTVPTLSDSVYNPSVDEMTSSAGLLEHPLLHIASVSIRDEVQKR